MTKAADHDRDLQTLNVLILAAQRLHDIPSASSVLANTLKRIEIVSQRMEPIDDDKSIKIE